MFLLKQSVYSLRIFSPSKLKCIPAALVVYRELFKFYFNYCLWIAGCVIAVLIVNYISIPSIPTYHLSASFLYLCFFAVTKWRVSCRLIISRQYPHFRVDWLLRFFISFGIVNIFFCDEHYVKRIRIRSYSGPHSDWITPNTDTFYAVEVCYVM